MPDFMVDRAYWDPGILDAARACNANAVAVYAWDHYLKDVNGYCGGYTPEVVAQLYAAGLDVHFVFVFRDGEAPLDPATCVAVLAALGARPGAWVHNDIENGAMDSLAHDVAFNQAMRAAGYHPAPYGLASTLNGGYLQDADGAWVASYVAPWNSPPPLVNVPNVGAWDFIGWQFSTDSPPPVTVDVSVHNFPVAGGGKGTPTGGTTLASDEFNQLQGELQSHDGAIRDLQTRLAKAEGSLGAHDGAIRGLQGLWTAIKAAIASAGL